ncbi:MAG: zinc ribbon domain-containing protein [Anaerolineae bacterium]|nr:zinc ribbon domain-containing protein [Anaerolineae bacterium]
MECPECGAYNPPDSIFCGECGATVAQKRPEAPGAGTRVAAETMVRCAVCGAENVASAIFCSTCRAVLVPAARHGPRGSRESETEPYPIKMSGSQLAGGPDTPLPKRCPFCGRSVYPGEAHCLWCGADPKVEHDVEASARALSDQAWGSHTGSGGREGWWVGAVLELFGLLVRLLFSW